MAWAGYDFVVVPFACDTALPRHGRFLFPVSCVLILYVGQLFLSFLSTSWPPV